MFKLVVPEPKKLSGVAIHGFAASDAAAGSSVGITGWGGVTSDESLFHKALRGLAEVVEPRLQDASSPDRLDRLSRFLLIIHADDSASWFSDTFPLASRARIKREFKDGINVVFDNDIADITSLYFPEVQIHWDDRIVLLERIGWKFMFVFDLDPRNRLGLEEFEKLAGRVHCRLQYENVYAVIEDEKALTALIDAGWFPFVEISGNETKRLLYAHQKQLGVAETEEWLLARFDDNRMSLITSRWWTHPVLEKRKSILQGGIDAYATNNSVACIKTLVTELEGILIDGFGSGTKQKLTEVLTAAVESGTRKAGSQQTLFFQTPFLAYLKGSIYRSFDRLSTDHASRHSVGHGAAPGHTYSKTRALQTILTMDQVYWYL